MDWWPSLIKKYYVRVEEFSSGKIVYMSHGMDSLGEAKKLKEEKRKEYFGDRISIFKRKIS